MSWWVVYGMVSCWDGSEASLFHAGSVVLLTVMVTFSGNAPFLLLLRFVKILSFMISSQWIRVIGQDACSGTDGFLCFLVSMEPSSGLADASEGAFHMLEVALGCYSSNVVSEWLLRGLMLLKLLEGCQMFLMFGPTVVWFWSLLLLALGSLPISLCFPGVHVGGAMLIMFALLGMKGSLAGVSFRFQGLYRLFRGSKLWGVILALQSSDVVHLGVDHQMSFGILDVCWMVVVALLLVSWSMIVTFFCSLIGCYEVEGMTRSGSRRLWFLTVRFVNRTRWEMMLPMRLLIWVAEGLAML